MPVVPVTLDIGPTKEHRGNALIRHIKSKSPKTMPGGDGSDKGGNVGSAGQGG